MSLCTLKYKLCSNHHIAPLKVCVDNINHTADQRNTTQNGQRFKASVEFTKSRWQLCNTSQFIPGSEVLTASTFEPSPSSSRFQSLSTEVLVLIFQQLDSIKTLYLALTKPCLCEIHCDIMATSTLTLVRTPLFASSLSTVWQSFRSILLDQRFCWARSRI